MWNQPVFRFGVLARASGLVAVAATVAACAPDGAEPAGQAASGASVEGAATMGAATTTFALAEFEGYANPATGEFRVERVTDLNPLLQIAALYEGDDVRTIGQAGSLPASLPRSTPAPWCTGRIANDGVIGDNPPDSFELWTDPASIGAALPGGSVPSACNVGNTSLYSIDGVFCATVRAMNFYDVGWDDVYAQLYLSTGDAATQGAYAYPFGTGAQTLGLDGDPLPDLVGLPTPGDEFGIWSYGDLSASGGQGTVTWAFRNATTGSFRFRGRVIGRLAEDCSTPDINEDCDPLGLGDNACRLYTTGEACNDDLDCESYSCVGGFCADGCRDGLYGNACQFECPGGWQSPCTSTAAGTCNDGRDGTGVCTCNVGYSGLACQVSCANSCAGILAANPGAPNGEYELCGNIPVYCAMTEGAMTYEALGFGNYLASFPGWTLVDVSVLSSPGAQAAFLWAYNRQGGLLNLQPGWNSGNCCFKNGLNPGSFLALGGGFLYPTNADGAYNCNGGYASPLMRFMSGQSYWLATPPLPANFFSTYPVGLSNSCSDSNNPAFYFRRYN